MFVLESTYLCYLLLLSHLDKTEDPAATLYCSTPVKAAQVPYKLLLFFLGTVTSFIQEIAFSISVLKRFLLNKTNLKSGPSFLVGKSVALSS